METIKQLISSGNPVVWILLVLLLWLCIMALKSAAKALLLLLAFAVCVFIVMKFFPGVAEPIVDFIRGGWLKESWADGLGGSLALQDEMAPLC